MTCQSIDPTTGLRCEMTRRVHRHGALDDAGVWHSWG